MACVCGGGARRGGDLKRREQPKDQERGLVCCRCYTQISSPPLPASSPLTQVLSALCELLSAAPMEDGDSVHRALVALGTVCHEDAELCGLAKEMGVQVRGRGMVREGVQARGGARSWLEHQAGCRADSRQAANLPIRTLSATPTLVLTRNP